MERFPEGLEAVKKQTISRQDAKAQTLAKNNLDYLLDKPIFL
jgi:hypothetical protein